MENFEVVSPMQSCAWTPELVDWCCQTGLLLRCNCLPCGVIMLGIMLWQQSYTVSVQYRLILSVCLSVSNEIWAGLDCWCLWPSYLLLTLMLHVIRARRIFSYKMTSVQDGTSGPSVNTVCQILVVTVPGEWNVKVLYWPGQRRRECADLCIERCPVSDSCRHSEGTVSEASEASENTPLL